MRAIAALLVAASLGAQVFHADTGVRVSAENPAAPGERLALVTPGGIERLFIGGEAVEWRPVGPDAVEFDLPFSAAGSFLELNADGRAVSIEVNRADGVELDASEVRDLVTRAAMAVDNARLAVAVVDRAGRPLAIFRRPGASPADVEVALSLARTGAFFSHNQAPLSSRTVRSISTINFPEGIPNQPSAALYGIENTNRGCSFNTEFLPGKAVPQSRNASGTGTSLGISTFAGGLPVYRNGAIMVGGIGAGGVEPNVAEFAVVAATFGTPFFVGLPLPQPGAVFIDGFRLPFVEQTTQPAGTQPAASLGGVFDVGPLHGTVAPDEWLAGPRGSATLSAAEVRQIIERAVARAARTRAVIRLPLGSRTRMVVGVTDLQGNVLGLFRMPDSTIFSIDVAVAKARNVVYFTGPNADPRDLAGVAAGTAFTNRTIGFGGQPLFPSGILNSTPGPFFDVYQYDLANPCTQGRQAANPNQSGIVFFPGSAPLYRGGQLVGGLGVSGDGVEQDDYVTAGGAEGFEAPAERRADQVFVRGVRLPYWKFPRNPEQ
ncbi:MAG: heme-binding protein [Bryobacteraceae bacterium]